MSTVFIQLLLLLISSPLPAQKPALPDDCGGLCALHCDYRVVRKDGKWMAQANGICTAS